MRPLELRLRNFRSYFGPETTFSFRDRTLVGIVGPIGSGKSSILDAISFALYGKTPTVGSATRGLIHQRTTEGTVALRFEIDGTVWEAVRMLRAKGQSQHALYRLAADEPGAEPIEKVTMEGDVNARIVELLGLEFDTFGRSVLLAQGRFAEFLQARPAERDKVLKGVFGHDRLDTMREAAKARGAALGVDLEKLGVRVEQLDRVAARLAQRREQVGVLLDRLEVLQKAEPEIDELDRRIRECGASVAESDKRGADVRELAGRLPEPSAADRLVDEAASAAAKRAALAGALEAAQAALADADAAVDAAAEAGVARIVDEATQQIAAAGPLDRAAREAARKVDELAARLTSQDEAIVKAAARQSAGAVAVAATAAEVAETVAVHEATEAALMEVRHADMASTLRAGLHDGDTCPVCAQEVPIVPSVEPSADAAAAGEAVTSARRARDMAEAGHTKAVAEEQGSAEALAGLEAERARVEAEHVAAVTAAKAATDEHAAAVASLGALLGDGDPGDLLERLRAENQARSSAAADARKVLDRVRADHDAAIRDQQELGKRLSALRVDLVDLVARLQVDVPVPGDDDPDLVRSGFVELRRAVEELTAELDATRKAAASSGAVAEEARTALLAELGVAGSPEAAIAAAAAEADVLARSVADDEAELDQAADLLARRDELTAQETRYDQIASDLTDSRFVRYLLDDERSRLAALGSEHFERLSSGRYRFSENGKFDILDLTAAEAERKADSLSGGETFLASLALALALAEMVARTGGRLDAFFLDEGFGSLDAEHLDLAMEGIEALVAGGSDRLVVVVSHVPEMRQRLEDVIILDRDPRTGDTKVMSA
jgi:exonuclease SbcC